MNRPPSEKDPGIVEERLRQIEERLSDKNRIPLSSYRLQFNREFTFRDARAIVSYLAKLGISHCYASPYLAAGDESTHGYDIADFNRINPEIGGDPEFKDFVKELQENGLGQILDFVPNHMGISSYRNLWWQDVLENGPGSRYAGYFDIDWNPIKAELRGKVLLPILGDQYGVVLERGELQLQIREGRPVLQYFDCSLPINPETAAQVLGTHRDRPLNESSVRDSSLNELGEIAAALKNLPSCWGRGSEQIQRREREKNALYGRLDRLMKASPDIRRYLDNSLKIFNGEPGRSESFDPLHQLLEQQYYRLSYWRTAAAEINFRRFFDINHLAGLRMERQEVFDATHVLVLRLIGEGILDGLRLDHVDGLFRPEQYFDRLQEATWLQFASRDEVLRDMDPRTLSEKVRQWRKNKIKEDPFGVIRQPLYLVAEKILTGSESLPEHWALHGTNGYDFLNDVNGLFVDSSNEKAFTRIYTRYTGNSAPFSEIVYAGKKLIMQTALTSELNVLVRALNLISEENRYHRDFTLNSLREALTEVIACFPIYRTYINQNGCVQEDREILETAIARARGANPALEPTIFDFLRNSLVPGDGPPGSAAAGDRRLNFIMKFQQFTGPVQAKGVEDTAFYRYNRLVSLNEVGGQPQRFGHSASVFHARNVKRQKSWPWSMIATATHDHKRGEDARARLNVLSEIPELWRKAIRRWSLLNRSKRTPLEGGVAPDRNDEYLFYQTLLAIWPPLPSEQIDFDKLIGRIQTYMDKAIKEAKIHSSWINPNEEYEQGVKKFVERVLSRSRSKRFLEDFLPFQKTVARAGVVNSLAQVLLKINSPGMPDFYQGTELWDLSLVDPDNRRAVDFEHRRRLLDELEPLLECSSGSDEQAAALAGMLNRWQDGRVKMFVTACGLRFRRAHPDLFLYGDYQALQAEGEHADRVVAFVRQHQGQVCLTVVPRLAAGLMQPDWPVGETAWADTRLLLPNGLGELSFRDRLTAGAVSTAVFEGRTVLSLKDLFAILPVALLAGEFENSRKTGHN